MKFLCDEMLANLARWLRAAGYDTLLAQQRASDRALLEQARTEDRWLLTRDHKLLEFRAAPGRVLRLRGAGARGLGGGTGPDAAAGLGIRALQPLPGVQHPAAEGCGCAPDCMHSRAKQGVKTCTPAPDRL